MGRAPCCEKVGLKRGPWTTAEDLRLIQYIETHGEGGWRALPKAAGLLRCGKSCRLRWFNYLRPDLKRGNISEDEERLIIKLHSLFGNRWSLIAGQLPGRTDNEIKNHWNAHLKKRLRAMGIDPETHQPLHHHQHHYQLNGAPQLIRKGQDSLPKSTTTAARPRCPVIGIKSKPLIRIGAEGVLSGYERAALESKPGPIPGVPARPPLVEIMKSAEPGPSSCPAVAGAHHETTVSHHYGNKETAKAEHQTVPAAANQICVLSNLSNDHLSSVAHSNDAALHGDQVLPTTISGSRREPSTIRALSIEEYTKSVDEVHPLINLQTGDDDELQPENINLWSLLEYGSESLWGTEIIRSELEEEFAIGSPVSVDAGAWADLWGMEGMFVGPSLLD